MTGGAAAAPFQPSKDDDQDRGTGGTGGGCKISTHTKRVEQNENDPVPWQRGGSSRSAKSQFEPDRKE